jgi:hypothetical protein
METSKYFYGKQKLKRQKVDTEVWGRGNATIPSRRYHKTPRNG